ncbi:cytochrome c biogenesis CcdA family protein [Candidatus Pelagibacter communis]|jgi:cytochrome c-type biogenesis protein|uniref:Probable holocytochrome-c synthase ccdA n=1 Tax=Pelagibacter ubique (strain HTCC1062) TaxID=335992 RepID=Q4FMJ0_PELUB|nr:cytochrome c biogenesis protein CcdA [Candidatus Pelagibacter ubique]MBT3562264.1 cytochrome C biogenesis protein CcdA [Flavobacteriaceae bacterium]MDA9985466.1 cytochrome c biogenesis protein CcdA [Candidatus Pelagibacter sp.]AAZ21599.1 probable holocytochrome-c synthase ccdA [Candidatus Pelagibacter ubique HTCC1062]MDA7475897.1 cytochrome c biogenesis protein CcdA [Candidatus Pelagibacter ubique]MDA8945139.1 cytochrome c biogenesis protein CcdA [Candidatus Pelagibacter ubique]
MIELIIAFGAGLISFLSPCVLPLIPGYVSFITGSTLSEILEKKKIDLLPLIVFSLGFSFVFIIFGATASFLGQILLQNSQILRIIAGVIIIIFSLQLIGVLNIKFLNIEKKFYTKKSNNIFFIFIVGMAFGFGWTPCIGPILGSILALASTEETIYKAILLLSFYSLGLAIPFILSGYLMQKFLLFSKNFKKNINLVTKGGGIILLITGILILTNQLQVLGYYILNYLPFLQNFG